MRWLGVAAALVCVLGLRCACRGGRAPLRFATFNIENFPKDARQIDGAFREIAETRASVVAVQEIGAPTQFASQANRRLGERWRFVSIDTRPIGETRPGHHIGVLYDSERFELVSWRSYDDTRLDAGRHKPVLEVRLRDGGVTLRVLVVHLKSGSEGRELRARQLAALGRVVAYDGDRHETRGDRTIVLGDFNATERGDRDDLAILAKQTGLAWPSEPLACTAFWDRDDGCPRSRLDHVLMWKPPTAIRAAGGCSAHGCDWEASCPLYAHEVSDHCPVVVDVDDVR